METFLVISGVVALAFVCNVLSSLAGYYDAKAALKRTHAEAQEMINDRNRRQL